MLEHGGRLRAAAQRLGRDAGDWIDLSAGLNPVGYPAPPIAADAWQRLPETDPALLAAACAYYGAPRMLTMAGTQAAIQLLPQLRAPSRVVVSAPSYAEHAHHWARHGHTMREVAFADLDAAVDECDVLVVCNPNNPTGEMIAADILLAWAARLAARGGWLVVDEAFADTAPANSVCAASAMPGLIVLRSLGKFFGLAGVRVGFVAADAAVLDALAELAGPWCISGPAQHIAIAALRDHAWQADGRARLLADGARLRALLAAHDIASHGCALFQWWPETQAPAFWQHMAERGILVRLFTNAARGIRLGLPPDDASWRRLSTALTQWTDRAQ
jgi:cobalamin biosynthetic protein CobC